MTGLALVAGHPGRVRTLVAHEPPLLELLGDAEQQRADTEDIIATFHAEGMRAAWFKFMVHAGFDKAVLEGAPGHAEPQEPSEKELAEAASFFGHELLSTTQYLPDVDALKASRRGRRHRCGLGPPAHLPDVDGAVRAARQHAGRVPRRPRRIHRPASGVRGPLRKVLAD